MLQHSPDRQKRTAHTALPHTHSLSSRLETPCEPRTSLSSRLSSLNRPWPFTSSQGRRHHPRSSVGVSASASNSTSAYRLLIITCLPPCLPACHQPNLRPWGCTAKYGPPPFRRPYSRLIHQRARLFPSSQHRPIALGGIRPSRLRSELSLAPCHGLHWSLVPLHYPRSRTPSDPAQPPSPTHRPRRPREPAPSLATRRLGHLAALHSPEASRSSHFGRRILALSKSPHTSTLPTSTPQCHRLRV